MDLTGQRPERTSLADHDFIPAEPVSDQPLPGVWIANIGRQTRRSYKQRAHDRLAAIEQPVSTGWALREAHKIAGLEMILTLRVAQGGRSGQDQQPLLPPVYAVWAPTWPDGKQTSSP